MADLLPEPEVDPDTPETILLRRTAYAELLAAVAKLPEKLGVVVTRHYGLGGEEPETYEAIGASMGKKKGSIASLAQRAHWQLSHLLKERPELPVGPLDAEELEDLQQLAHGLPATSFWSGVPRKLTARGLIHKVGGAWTVTEQGAHVAHVSLANPFTPYLCRCPGRWAACPLCGATYHTHNTSKYYLPIRCEECRGELDPANEQGPHLKGDYR